MRISGLTAAAAALLLATAAAAATPANIAAALADNARPAADAQRDADRKPAEMLEFAGVRPGMTVVELLPGGGYFTRLFAKAVGPKGTVYAVYPPPRPSTDPAKPTPAPAIEALAADPAYGNVRLLKTPLGAMTLPGKADVVWTSQNYHDLHNSASIDVAAFNKAVYAGLKPGGVYVLLDHAAAPGDPKVTETLHRIDPAQVRKEVEAAGFRFDGESRVLRSDKDDHTLKVFDPAIRGHTDQFVYRFRKP